MDVFPPGYEVSQTTWLYLSVVLIVTVYFRFHRFWSLRNLDLCLLTSASPALLLVTEDSTRAVGFTWLFVVTGLILLRLLIDPVLRRRPHVGQNLNAPGLAFLCAAAFALLTMQSIRHSLPASAAETLERADHILQGEEHPAEVAGEVSAGPAAPLLVAPVGIVFEDLAARVIAALAHLAVILGLVFLGRNLFGDMQLGLGMATLYLLLPCTAYDVGEVNYVLPAALTTWAIVAYRRPATAGVLMGLACGTMFFPLFLLPLWISFYGRRGALRFILALVIVGASLLTVLAVTSADITSLLSKTLGTVNLDVLKFEVGDTTQGFWTPDREAYRIPVLVAFLVMLVSLTIWPRKKNVEHLIGFSAAIIVGIQFWYPQQGGVYMLWYLPLLLAAIFRPRLMHLTPPDREADDGVTRARTGNAPGIQNSSFDRVHLFR
ncbi:hypothetical protein [Maioricimonas sp. JC845]|uniref:hypothetical protein n=1 Tax=Maioricimonas sp. JC845 TaxID=3232138 RepID=UPI00345A50C1